MPSFDTNTNANDLAKLYDQSFVGMERFQVGQVLETQVQSISKDTIFLQLNGKNEGILARDEMVDKAGDLTVKVGDPVKVFFLRSDNGEMVFTTRISGEAAGPELLERAFHENIPVEGVVEKEIKGGYEVKIGETRAFCPYSQMGERRTETSGDYVGKHLTFKIQEYKENGRKIVVSNRVLHEEARQENLEELKKTLHEGMIVKGTITSLQDFGAFVDLHGAQALLPVSEIGRSRVADIRAVLSVGQEVEASILKIDWSAKRISLSTKSLLADPWDQAVSQYPEGSKHSGKVVRVTNFGAFVSLEPGLDGLVHVSEFKNSSTFDNGNGVKPGQTLSVQVQTVDRANKRISLRPATTDEEDKTVAQYMNGPSDDSTYNPFAALLKKK